MIRENTEFLVQYASEHAPRALHGTFYWTKLEKDVSNPEIGFHNLSLNSIFLQKRIPHQRGYQWWAKLYEDRRTEIDSAIRERRKAIKAARSLNGQPSEHQTVIPSKKSTGPLPIPDDLALTEPQIDVIQAYHLNVSQGTSGAQVWKEYVSNVGKRSETSEVG